MKILIVHNYYQEPGGEDVVVSMEKKLLEDAGHEVFTYFKSNAEIRGITRKVRTFCNLHYSVQSKHEFEQTLAQVNPEVVHIHNLFMVITPSIIDSCWERGIPVVMTLHNYRLLSPNALFFHAGRLDTKSLNGSAYHCCLHRCYHNSFLLTAMVARMIEYHRKRNTWNTRVSSFIVPTEFSKQKFIEAGFHESKLAVKPNFLIQQTDRTQEAQRENVYLFVGRLSEEKGIRFLLESWRGMNQKLRIIGDGPLKNLVEEEARRNRNLEYFGFLPRTEILGYLCKAAALIFPSLWYEVFPMIILESFSAGTPVVCSRIGGLPEIVLDRYNGLLFDPGEPQSLKDAVRLFDADGQLQGILSNHAKTSIEKYSAEKNYELLAQIYRDAVAERSAIIHSLSSSRHVDSARN
jgi:glycosyltransferase involved in cell wall biosynthesis